MTKPTAPAPEVTAEPLLRDAIKEALSDYSRVSRAIAHTIEKGSKKLTDNQFMCMAGAVAIYLELAAAPKEVTAEPLPANVEAMIVELENGRGYRHEAAAMLRLQQAEIRRLKGIDAETIAAIRALGKPPKEVTAEPLPADVEAMAEGLWHSANNAPATKGQEFLKAAAAMLRRLAPKEVTAEPVAWVSYEPDGLTWYGKPLPTETDLYAHPPVATPTDEWNAGYSKAMEEAAALGWKTRATPKPTPDIRRFVESLDWPQPAMPVVPFNEKQLWQLRRWAEDHAGEVAVQAIEQWEASKK